MDPRDPPLLEQKRHPGARGLVGSGAVEHRIPSAEELGHHDRRALNYASSKAGADRVVALITGDGGRAIAVQADGAKQADIDRLFGETVKAFGRLDILVNNAGIYEFLPLTDITEEHFHRQFDLNVLGVLLASKEAVKHFGAAGGSIVNISASASRLTPATAAVYSATKAAVDAITTSLAKELGPRNIRVNVVNPGMVETEGVHAAGMHESEFRKQLEALCPRTCRQIPRSARNLA